MLVVYAKTEPAAGARGITAFIIEKGMQGILDRAEARQARHARLRHLRAGVRGLRGAGGERAGAENRRRVNVLMSGLDYERAVLAAGRSASCRPRHGRGPALRPRAQAVRPADRDVPADAGQGRRHVRGAERVPRLRLRRGAGLRCAATATRKDAAGCILLCRRDGDAGARSSDPSCWAATATSTTIPSGRLLRDAKLYEIGAGTSEIRRMLIGRELFEAAA